MAAMLAILKICIALLLLNRKANGSKLSKKYLGRASINFQTREVPVFLPLKFGSPTGKSRKSHYFPCCSCLPFLQQNIGSYFSVIQNRHELYLFQMCFKKSLSLLKIRWHLFGKPVLVCWTIEKASTFVQLRIHFKAQRKKKRK